MFDRQRVTVLTMIVSLLFLLGDPSMAFATPRVIVISLDGAKPDLVERYLALGVLDSRTGLGRLRRAGARAEQNVTATPSVTAVSHIAIATGSTAVHNDIPANTFHPVGAPIATSVSGFGAPIGGYALSPLGPSPMPTAEPLWVRLRAAGRSVVTATWPGSDGADIRIAGTLVQGAVPTRTTEYSLPFGAFGGLGARGFTLDVAAWTDADATLLAQLAAAGLVSFTPPRVTSAPLETVYCAPTTSSTCGTTADFGRTRRYDLKLAALDSTDDGTQNFDRLVAFDGVAGLPVGPHALPSTGPAVFAPGGKSAKFYFEGSGNRVGTSFFANEVAADLSRVRLARYGANFIPRNAAVLTVVDDVNENVGFWVPQPDFRIPERLSPGFSDFSDAELEAIYRDQVTTFTDYQTQIGLRAIARNPDADLLMIYFEQPDGSGHQFTLTDWRQATDPLDPTSIGLPGFPAGATGQDYTKVFRYASHLRFAYRAASDAVEKIVQAAGVDRRGVPLADVFVVSDHGMAPFHSAVSLRNLLVNAGIDANSIGIRTTGPAAHIYVNLVGREPGGTVTPEAYAELVPRIAGVLHAAKDGSRIFNIRRSPLFSHVYKRPLDCGRPGFCTSDDIGQDSGDVFALMAEGYNFDGLQSPGVARLGDPAFDAATTVFSVPNFYGAHGHDSELPSMSAILYAAGPSVKPGVRLRRASNLDIAPTVLEILEVEPAATVDGSALSKILRWSK